MLFWYMLLDCRVFSFPEDYYVLTQIHCCNSCYATRKIERMGILEKRKALGDNNLKISRSEYKSKPYTFRSYHPKVLAALPHGRGSCFTARFGRRFVPPATCYPPVSTPPYPLLIPLAGSSSRYKTHSHPPPPHSTCSPHSPNPHHSSLPTCPHTTNPSFSLQSL